MQKFLENINFGQKLNLFGGWGMKLGMQNVLNERSSQLGAPGGELQLLLRTCWFK